MVERTHIESLLRIHGISPSAPDEEIRSILFSAKYNKDEIDTALTVIRQDQNTKQDRIEGMRKIYRADEALSPAQISALLGIEVTIDPTEVKINRDPRMSLRQMVIFFFTTVFFAALGLLFALYITSSGPFHPTVSALGL
jgi:hypothetical protein